MITDRIIEVIDLSEDYEVNHRLAQGWRLLDVLQYRDEEFAHIRYVLGWPEGNNLPPASSPGETQQRR